MKKLILIVLSLLVVANFTLAQTAPKGKIKVEAVTEVDLTTMGLPTNSVSSGLNVVGNLTYVYLSAWNWASSDTIQTATFTIGSKPSGSTTTLTTFGNKWVYFKPDVVGEYVINLHIVTAGGSHDTTTKIISGNWVGVGNYEGVSGTFPKCMTCHMSNSTFTDIYNRWKVSGHATIFKTEIISGDHYSTACMKCHTTGYDHDVVAANNGFDDIAASLGWVYRAPSTQAKWDSLVTYFPNLVNHATIGCEMCHGAGSQHATSGNVAYIQKTFNGQSCMQCHDEPWRHNKVREFVNSGHSIAVWSSSFAQSTGQNNSLANCIRCHDAAGYINFTKGKTTNTTGMTAANHQVIDCATCHDPHGNSNTASLRNTPAGSDTLANAWHYTRGGSGMTCFNCHKARTSYERAGAITSNRWGPHHSTQADIFFGQNAAQFDTIPFQSTSHSYAITNACVGCHMAATPDTGNVNRSKVGGHSFAMSNPTTGFDNTVGCTNCHGPKNSFADFKAVADYDGNGQVEAVQKEVTGLIAKLVRQLPPVGVDSIDWNLIKNAPEPVKKAYWNYQMIANDGSLGMHNTKFTIDVLTKSIIAAGGSVPVELTSFTANTNGNSVLLNWSTATETNNKGFSIERKVNGNWSTVGFINGKGSTTSVNNYSFSDNLVNISGTVVYRLRQIDLDGSTHISKEVEVNIAGLPTLYALNQNYPNPFNPSTVINYSLPMQSSVKIVVYNIAGEEIKTLVNGTIEAGNHSVKFEAGKQISSGIYFYTLEAKSADGKQSYKETKKMMLIK